ncbi:MAG: molybdopterin-binding protein [Termitinemataceae bacterium]|nr:MAG: molybdopterin-binding protein [Termitinemataceae bacterium]
MKQIPVKEAVGHVLCHDLTRIVAGKFKGAAFKKGHVVTKADIPMLLSMGKEHIFVGDIKKGFIHEDEAAKRLDRICRGQNVYAGAPSEGKIEHFAKIDGLCCIDENTIRKINAVGDLLIATRHNKEAVKKGDKLAAMKALPLSVSEKKLIACEAFFNKDGGFHLINVLPYVLKTAALIATGSEIKNKIIKDTFTPVVAKKLKAFGIKVIDKKMPGDKDSDIACAIDNAKKLNPDIIICCGGMSVDSDDNTPSAIKKSGAKIIFYGAPVFPGAMFLYALLKKTQGKNIPVLGLPACVMFGGATIFDILLPRIAAGVEITKGSVLKLSIGGLCLGCKECKYPECPFGKE